MGVDAVGAGIGAGRTIPFVYGIRSGYSLCVWLINRLSVLESLIVKAWETHRANLGTIPASGALVNIDIPCAFVQRDLEIAGFPGNLFYLGYGVKLYIDVPADLDQFR